MKVIFLNEICGYHPEEDIDTFKSSNVGVGVEILHVHTHVLVGYNVS